MTQHPFHALIRRTQRHLALRRGGWTAVTAIALLGAFPVILGATGFPSAAIVAGAVGVAVAGGVGVWAALRVCVSDAARLVDRELTAKWALFTAWELSATAGAADAADAGGPPPSADSSWQTAFAAKLCAEANATTRDIDGVPMPAWQHPIFALMAVVWVALGTWMLVVAPVEISPDASPADWFGARTLAPMATAASDAGDETAAAHLRHLQEAMLAGDANAIAQALADLERHAADRRRAHQRQSELIGEAQQTADAIERGELSPEALKAALDRLAEAAQTNAHPDFPTPTPDHTPAEIAEMLREWLAQHDRQLGHDRQLSDRLEMAAMAVRQHRPELPKPPPPHATADPTTAARPEQRDTPSPGHSANGSAAPRNPTDGTEAPVSPVESGGMPVTFAGPSAGEESARMAETAVLPVHRGVWRRVGRWQEAHRVASGAEMPSDPAPHSTPRETPR